MVDYVAAITNPNDAFMKARTYAEQLQGWSNQKSAGAQYAMGDRAGAGRTLATGGDIAGAQGIEANEAKQIEAQQAYVGKAAPVLQQIYAKGGPQAFLQAFDSLGPDFQRLGMSQDSIGKMRQRMQADPQGALQMLTALGRGKVNVSSNGGITRVLDESGNLIAEYGQREPKYMALQASATEPAQIVAVGGDGRATQVPIGQPTGGAQPNPQPAPVMGSAAGAPSMPPAPVPQVPQTAAAPAVPQPMPPAAGAVQPQVYGRPAPNQVNPAIVRPGAMPGATQPPVQPGAITRTPPPYSAPPSAGPEFSGAGAPNRQVAGGLGAPAQPESNLPGLVGSARVVYRGSSPKPAPVQARPATDEDRARWPGASGIRPDGTPIYAPRASQQPLAQQEQIFLTKTRERANQALQMAQDMERFIELNRGIETGQRYYLDIAKSLAASSNDTISEMHAIVEQNVPLRRQGLPGAATERDVQMFRAGGPTLDKPRAANEAIARVTIAMARRQQDYAAFLEDWATNHGTIRGAQEAWGKYAAANPLYEKRGGNTVVRRITPWRQWFEGQGGQQQAPAAGDGWSIQRVQ